MTNQLDSNSLMMIKIRNIATIFCLIFCSITSQSAAAALFELSITGQVTANQSNIYGNCGVQGFSACPSFPLQSSATITMTFDNAAPIDFSYPAADYYANAITSINFDTDLFSSSYDSANGFGMISVTNNKLRFHLWDSGTYLTRTGSGNQMHLTPIPTAVAQPSDDVYGDIEIQTLVIDLVGLNAIFNKNLPVSPLGQSDFDLQASDWGVRVKSLGTNGLTVGWGGSAGGGITDISLTNIPAVPVPAAVWMFGSGLIGLVGIARRKKA